MVMTGKGAAFSHNLVLLYDWHGTSRTDHPNSGWASLTEAERRVAAAVAEGLTSRKVAERLSLSWHAVDFHLRQIFLKRGIRSRVELTRLVVQEPGPD
jgi:DNA-binding CsgD family transcriptional regulator